MFVLNAKGGGYVIEISLFTHQVKGIPCEPVTATKIVKLTAPSAAKYYENSKIDKPVTSFEASYAKMYNIMIKRTTAIPERKYQSPGIPLRIF